jgi:hypothetical protein
MPGIFDSGDFAGTLAFFAPFFGRPVRPSLMMH